MIYLLSKLFAQVAPLFNFVGDHRYGAVTLLLVAAAAAAWAYLPVLGARTAKILLVAAVAFFCFDWGYSHRAAIDRAAWKRAEAARQAAVDAKVAEWKTAAEDIARDATARAEDDARDAQAQREFIAGLPKGSAHENADPLFLDPPTIGLVRAFDAAGRGDADSAGPAKEFRQAGALAKSERCAALKLFCLRNRAAAAEANRRLVSDGKFYRSVVRKFSAKQQPSTHGLFGGQAGGAP